MQFFYKQQTAVETLCYVTVKLWPMSKQRCHSEHVATSLLFGMPLMNVKWWSGAKAGRDIAVRSTKPPSGTQDTSCLGFQRCVASIRPALPISPAVRPLSEKPLRSSPGKDTPWKQGRDAMEEFYVAMSLNVHLFLRGFGSRQDYG